MALKPCKECKNAISQDANPCPHCGKKNPHGMSRLLKFGGAAVGIVIVLAAIAPGAKTSKATSGNSVAEAPREAKASREAKATDEAKATGEAKPPALAVDAIKLWQDYDANEVAADGIYKGKILKVTGTVASIDKDFLDNIIVHLKSPNPIMNTMAKLEKSESSKAAALNKGAPITLTCEGAGRVVGSPSLDDCTISN